MDTTANDAVDTALTDPATGLTAQDRRRAAVVACSYATDVDDAREILEALGLVDELRQDLRVAS